MFVCVRARVYIYILTLKSVKVTRYSIADIKRKVQMTKATTVSKMEKETRELVTLVNSTVYHLLCGSSENRQNNSLN